jgi:hypothetical protein
MSSTDSSAADATPHHSPGEILAHPRFLKARRVYVQGILGLYEHDPFMNRLLIETGRSIIFFSACPACGT